MESAGRTITGAKRLRTVVPRQLRSIAKSPDDITRETNAQLLKRLNIVDPYITYLRKRLETNRSETVDLLSKLDPADARLHPSFSAREQQIILGMQNMEKDMNAHNVSLSVPIACPECGREFLGMAALNAHRCKAHQFIGRETTTKMQKQVDRYLNSVDGLPICKHCGRKFTRWPQLLQHIGRQLCPTWQASAHSLHLQDGEAELRGHEDAGGHEPLTAKPVLFTLRTGQLRLLPEAWPPLGHLQQRCHLCNQWLAHPHFI